MKAIVFEYKLRKLALSRILGIFGLKYYLTKYGCIQYKEVPEPELLADDYVVIRTHYCGICGSDTKQSFLDGNMDNPMTAIISWPQILGHEVVGPIERVGKKSKLKVGDRVVLNPWLSCLPRGISPPCKSCQEGKNTLCRNFKKGILAPGIHTGNSATATGGFAELVPAHDSMAIPVPDSLTWKQAVLSDPFSVALHSILKVRPQPGSVCVVYGCGNLGLLTVDILKNVFEDLTVLAIARFPQQKEMAKKFGADQIIDPFPANKVIEKIGDYLNCDVYYPNKKRPWLIEGVDYLFDTVASKETLETGIRITKARDRTRPGSGTIVVTGVSSPKRYEWTPIYFKDLRIIGSNAFAVEEFEGHREHAYYHYFRFLEEGRVDPSEMVSHVFPVTQYRDALVATRNQGKSGAMKVVLSYVSDKEGDK
jgi:threonine dehydrogenase-like Zn-dependent dehydrogenase